MLRRSLRIFPSGTHCHDSRSVNLAEGAIRLHRISQAGDRSVDLDGLSCVLT